MKITKGRLKEIIKEELSDYDSTYAVQDYDTTPEDEDYENYEGSGDEPLFIDEPAELSDEALGKLEQVEKIMAGLDDEEVDALFAKLTTRFEQGY